METPGQMTEEVDIVATDLARVIREAAKNGQLKAAQELVRGVLQREGVAAQFCIIHVNEDI